LPDTPLLYTVYIAAGSNLGGNGLDSAQTLRHSLDEVSASVGKVLAVSRYFRTPCFPAGNGPDFTNAVIKVETALPAEVCLTALHNVEQIYGRTRSVRWDARSLDLDLLDHDGQILPDISTLKTWIGLSLDDQKKKAPDQLILPHPRLQDRGFVLVPWADVAPNWRHPVIGQTVAEMRDALPDYELDEITVISDH